MAEIASWGEQIRDGQAALARGEWGEARAIFEQELEANETVDALEGLSWAAWWVEDVPTCLEARERAIANGWFQRAARLLEGVEACPEHGWLDALVGYMALVEGDTARAGKLAAQARGLGRGLG